MAFLADVRGLQPDVPAAALARRRRDAAARVHVCREHRLGSAQLHLDDRCGDPGDRDGRLLRESRSQPSFRRDRRRRSLGRVHAGVVHDLSAASGEFRQDPHGHRPPPAVGPKASRAERYALSAAVSLGQRPKIVQDRALLGVVIFIASESVFFLAIVLAYVAYRDAGLATAKANLDVARTAIFSVALFSSSATMAIAARRASRSWLVATIALGTMFLVGQGSEYARLLASGIGPGRELFGTTFFTLTGLHGVHVLGGLIALSALLAAHSRRPSALRPLAFEAVGLYWHFVDAVWVVVFSVVYLGTLL